MPSSKTDVAPLRLALVGYGRMAREVERVAVGRGHAIAARIHPSAADPVARAISAAALGGAEVALEFTQPEAAVANIGALAAAGCRQVVCGTTGWKARLAEIEALAAQTPLGLVHADNFSLGMALFTRLLIEATELFVARGGYDPYLVEWHHRGKRDAPSGTARVLARVIEEGAPGRRRHTEGVSEGIPAGVFQVAAVRAGAIPGTHLVGFESEADSIELRHTARGRGGFALGAVLAAEWLGGRAGVYTFDDVLEDEEEAR